MNENEKNLASELARLFYSVGEMPERDGLLETPARWIKAFREMTRGYQQDPAKILGKLFTNSSDEMVVLSGITFSSLCEHHLLPFVGTATIGYIPTGQVVGISKLSRLVECFAKRLQIQEGMTISIAQALFKNVPNHGVGVVIKAHHSCMSCRGIEKSGSVMTTSAMLGAFRDDPKTRSEFLSMVQ